MTVAGPIVVLESIEEEIQTAARADVDVRERTDVVTEQREHGKEEAAAADLVGLRRACGEQLLDLDDVLERRVLHRRDVNR